MIPLLHSAPTLELKISRGTDPGNESTIGYCSSIAITQVLGQKPIFVVDSPFPQEISQGAAPSFVRCTMQCWLPKGSTMESLGLVPYRLTKQNDNYLATSDYISLHLYDRVTGARVYTIDNAKVSQFTINVAAKQAVQVQIQAEGMYLSPGLAI